MIFSDWLDLQAKQINEYFYRRSKVKELIKDLETSTSLEWTYSDETGGLKALGEQFYWLDINKVGYNLSFSLNNYDTINLYGLDLDNVIAEVNKIELSHICRVPFATI